MKPRLYFKNGAIDMKTGHVLHNYWKKYFEILQ
jgi:hypothetical protein